MMFLGIMDIMMFSTMMSFMGMAMSSFIPDTQMYGDSQMSDTGSSDYGGGDMGHGDGGFGDTGGFDVNF
jgi:hypothetical protein